jgi:hypothetical protein
VPVAAQSAVRLRVQRHGVRDRLPVRQAALLQHHLDDLWSAHAPVVEVAVPPGQVQRRGGEPALVAVADRPEPAALALRVPLHAAGEGRARVGGAGGAHHPQRRQDPLALERARRHSGHALDHLVQQGVPGVVLHHPRARRKAEAGERGRIQAGPSGEPACVVVAQAAGVVDQVAQGDPRAVVRQVRQVLVDVVVQRQPALGRQQGEAEGVRQPCFSPRW